MKDTRAHAKILMKENKELKAQNKELAYEDFAEVIV